MSDPFSGMGGFDLSAVAGLDLMKALQQVTAWRGGPVNWDVARQVAAAALERDPGPRALPGSTAPAGRDDAELAQAVSVAELWLDAVTDLPAVDGPVEVLTPAEWARRACAADGLGVYVEPVAGAATTTLAGAVGELAGGLGGLSALAGGGDLTAAMRPWMAYLFGIQMGSVAALLARQLFGTYDLGLPTLEARRIGAIGTAAGRYAADHDIDPAEFRYLLALREAAHRRQHAGVGWLRGHVADLIGRFAAAAETDPSAFGARLGGLDLDLNAALDPDALRRALAEGGGSLVEPTPGQRAVLDELQALVAFTEAWVDVVVGAAAGDKLPSLARIDEALRRRRAERGPGEVFLSQLVGLELRPADVGVARDFCAAVVTARGQVGLDRAWRDAVHLPAAAELAEPSRWLLRLAAEEGDTGPGDGEPLLVVPDDLSELDPPA